MLNMNKIVPALRIWLKKKNVKHSHANDCSPPILKVFFARRFARRLLYENLQKFVPKKWMQVNVQEYFHVSGSM